MFNTEVTGVEETMLAFNTALAGLLSDMGTFAEEHAVANTPIRSGYARSQWQLHLETAGFEVINEVPYIERLEEGYSKQAPEGILNPTVSQIEEKYK